jgi:hypothetical protein
LSIHEKNIKVELKANYDLSFFNIMIFITSCWWWNSKPPHFKRKRKSTFLLFIVFPVVLAGDTLWHLQKFLQCIKYIIFEFTPFTILLYPSPFPDSWNSFNRYQFCICMHVYAFFFFLMELGFSLYYLNHFSSPFSSGLHLLFWRWNLIGYLPRWSFKSNSAFRLTSI